MWGSQITCCSPEPAPLMRCVWWETESVSAAQLMAADSLMVWWWRGDAVRMFVILHLTWLSACRHEGNKEMAQIWHVYNEDPRSPSTENSITRILSLSRCYFKLGGSQSAFLTFNNLHPLHCCLNSFISLETNNSINGFVWCLSEEVKLNFEWISGRAGSADPLFPEPLF